MTGVFYKAFTSANILLMHTLAAFHVTPLLNFHPCHIVPHFPLPHFQSSHINISITDGLTFASAEAMFIPLNLALNGYTVTYLENMSVCGV